MMMIAVVADHGKPANHDDDYKDDDQNYHNDDDDDDCGGGGPRQTCEVTKLYRTVGY